MTEETRPFVWGFAGALIVAVIAVIAHVAGNPLQMASPVAGGFFTGWLAGQFRNWSGRRR